MAFGFVFKRIWTEVELCGAIAEELQSAFDFYKDGFWILRLKRLKNRRVRVAYVKEFATQEEMSAFYWDKKFERATLGIKFINGKYDLCCTSFFWSGLVDVTESKCLVWYLTGGNYNIERQRSIPHNLVAGAFSEMSDLLKK